jgi:hypothetical protein
MTQFGLNLLRVLKVKCSAVWHSSGLYQPASQSTFNCLSLQRPALHTSQYCGLCVGHMFYKNWQPESEGCLCFVLSDLEGAQYACACCRKHMSSCAIAALSAPWVSRLVQTARLYAEVIIHMTRITMQGSHPPALGLMQSLA